MARRLASKLKEIHPKVKVLYISGYAGTPEAGFDFLQKPFSSTGAPDQSARDTGQAVGYTYPLNQPHPSSEGKVFEVPLVQALGSEG